VADVASTTAAADLEYKGDTFTGVYTDVYEVVRGTTEDAERDARTQNST